MEVKTFFSVKNGVSLPFVDFCSPVVNNINDFDEAFDAVIRFGEKKGWKTLELRGGKEYLGSTVPSESFLNHSIDLTKPIKEIRASLRDSTWRNIKKSKKQGVVVETFYTLEALKRFYALHCRTRHHHGMPPQPFYFFQYLHAQIISKHGGCVILASVNGNDVAGAIFLQLNGKVIFKYGASDKKYHKLRPNNLIMWSAINSFREKKNNFFEFGRTEFKNKGLLQYKKGWGTKEGIINYYKYDLGINSFITCRYELKSTNVLFKKMPLTLLRLCGHLFYRYIG